MDATTRVVSLFPRLIDGDVGVLAVFAEKATIDSPLQGHHEPPEFVAETRAWLSAHGARVEDGPTVVTEARVVHEFVLHLGVDGEAKELPVMLVADIDAENCIRDLRIYHSTWPLTGAHRVRSPLMQYTLADRPAEPVATYHAALAAGDARAADAVFEDGGSVREPAGAGYLHAGAARLGWYEQILSDGPLVLKLGTITDDGTTVVYEYEVDRWGATRIPPQAGAAAYERGSGGKLVSARIYDDIDPPSALGA